jgi:hypothetical protein
MARRHEAGDGAQCESSLGIEIVADVAELWDGLVGEETLSLEIADNVIVGRDGVLARYPPQRLVDAGPSFRLGIRVVDSRKSISVAVSQRILCDAGPPLSILGILPSHGAGSASEIIIPLLFGFPHKSEQNNKGMYLETRVIGLQVDFCVESRTAHVKIALTRWKPKALDWLLSKLVVSDKLGVASRPNSASPSSRSRSGDKKWQGFDVEGLGERNEEDQAEYLSRE